jgi:glycerol-3-phosphate acyltransferase PlsX
MGGDHAPEEVVRGAQLAAERGIRVVLVGQPEAIRPYLNGDDRLPIVEALDVIAMDDAPTVVRQRPNSSLARAIALVSSGDADAVVSAGNSGAIMVGALLAWGQQAGILRPAYGGDLPTRRGHTFIIDIGANTVVKPEHLLQFAIMGTTYMQVAHGIAQPTIGLLSNGTEDSKGTELVRQAHELLQRTNLNFVGNIEATQVFEGLADVVVTDGFTGNVLLKTAEGVAQEIFNLIRGEVNQDMLSRAGALLITPALARIKRRLDYEEYGGAPLLGVNGVMINAHGRSHAKAIANAICVAEQMARDHLVQRIGEELHRSHLDGRRRLRVIPRLHRRHEPTDEA